ncbi:hypothetical protein E1301_Tti023690 [Triplophysa tibetana]|uniref:Uncharacterized protein n=1 Tax=Triplophysa tibetana TaxID=1572043 RepID=A0A5A9P9L1_9TELE|nr:hypothetical protein E1301_Tti023690 [Triplophysa tibetana]
MKVHGHLDLISGFPHENYLKQIKRMVRKPSSPLQEVVRRISELHSNSLNDEETCKPNKICRMVHSDGPVPSGFTGTVSQFKELAIDDIVISSSERDRCIKINNKIVLVQNIIVSEFEEYIVYKEYRHITKFFDYPIESTELGICFVSDLSPNLMCFKLDTNYKTALLKLPEAEAHTDLQTAEEDEDENPKKKRKRLPNIRFESDSEEEVTVKQKRTLPPAPKIKMQNFDKQSAIRRHLQRLEPQKQMTSLDLRRSLTSPEPRELVKSPEHGRSTSPEPSWSVTSPQPHQLDESQRHSGTSTSNGLASLLHKLLTNQEMIMEQLKIIQMNLNKTGQPVQGQDPLKGDVLPLKDVAALLALEKRLREEEDLKNKMVTEMEEEEKERSEDGLSRTFLSQFQCLFYNISESKAQNSKQKLLNGLLVNHI